MEKCKIVIVQTAQQNCVQPANLKLCRLFSCRLYINFN